MSSLPSLSLRLLQSVAIGFGCSNVFGCCNVSQSGSAVPMCSAAAMCRNGARLLQSGSAATLLDLTFLAM